MASRIKHPVLQYGCPEKSIKSRGLHVIRHEFAHAVFRGIFKSAIVNVKTSIKVSFDNLLGDSRHIYRLTGPHRRSRVKDHNAYLWTDGDVT
jgi:hypothetical protein